MLMSIEHKRSLSLLKHLQLITTIHMLLLILSLLSNSSLFDFFSSSAVALCIICSINTSVMLIDSLVICDDCIKVDDDVMIEEDAEKELTRLTWDFAIIRTSISVLEDLVSDTNCYERTKTEQGWSPNQFAVNASEFSA